MALMQYFAATLPLVLGLLLCASQAKASDEPITVVIDPGHGGEHAGAVSPFGTKEKHVVLSVSRRLQHLLLNEGGIRVVMTRENDRHIPLRERVAMANQERGDLFLSIHCNSMPTYRSRRLAHGIETYLLSPEGSDSEALDVAARENAEDSEALDASWQDPLAFILDDLQRNQAHEDAVLLAGITQKLLVMHTNAKDRGVRQAPFRVLSGAKMPAVLVEIGFISHPDESRKLASAAYQQQLAEALRDAVLDFRRTVLVHRNSGPKPESTVQKAKRGEESKDAALAGRPGGEN